MDSDDICGRCKNKMDFKDRFPCGLNCGHKICLACRNEIMRTVNPQDDVAVQCPICQTEQVFNLAAMNQQIQSIQAMMKGQQIGQTSQGTDPGNKFECSKHNIKINYFNAKTNEFFCHKCIFEGKIDYKSVEEINETQIIEKCKELQKKLTEQIAKMQTSNKDLQDIHENSETVDQEKLIAIFQNASSYVKKEKPQLSKEFQENLLKDFRTEWKSDGWGFQASKTSPWYSFYQPKTVDWLRAGSHELNTRHDKKVGPWEKFKIEPMESNNTAVFAIKSCHGQYVSCKQNGSTNAKAKSVGQEEIFQFVPSSNNGLLIMNFASGLFLRINYNNRLMQCDADETEATIWQAPE